MRWIHPCCSSHVKHRRERASPAILGQTFHGSSLLCLTCDEQQGESTASHRIPCSIRMRAGPHRITDDDRPRMRPSLVEAIGNRLRVTSDVLGDRCPIANEDRPAAMV